MNYNTGEPAPPIVRPGAWRYRDGRPNLPGVRIDTGATMLFVPNEHVYKLAMDLATHLERNRA